jgi:quercetin dioxygenase-like cupin family protein
MYGTEQIVVERGAGGPDVSFAGNEVTFKIRGDQTSGAFSVAEFKAHPGTFIPPHFHEKTDEVSYVLEGELGVMVAEEEFTARTGTFVVRPKGVPHALWNSTDRAARFLDMYTPAGFEAWFDELARLLSAPTPPSLDQLNEAGRRYDTILLPELMQPLMARHNFKMPLR